MKTKTAGGEPRAYWSVWVEEPDHSGYWYHNLFFYSKRDAELQAAVLQRSPYRATVYKVMIPDADLNGECL